MLNIMRKRKKKSRLNKKSSRNSKRRLLKNVNNSRIREERMKVKRTQQKSKAKRTNGEPKRQPRSKP